jgi:hypothetical protein
MSSTYVELFVFGDGKEVPVMTKCALLVLNNFTEVHFQI